MTTRNGLKLILAGESGDGAVNTCGIMLADIFSRMHLLAQQTVSDFRSVIRSPDHISLTFCVGPERWLSTGNAEYDILISLEDDSHPDTAKKPNRWGEKPNRGSIVDLGGFVRPGGALIYDSTKNMLNPKQIQVFRTSNNTIIRRNFEEERIAVFPLQMSAIAKELDMARSRNMVSLGGVFALLQLPEAMQLLHQSLVKKFGKKQDGEIVVQKNMQAATIGYNTVRAMIQNTQTAPQWFLGRADASGVIAPTKTKKTITVSGNEAIALGAIAGGVRYGTYYPITPASKVGECLEKWLPHYGGIAEQKSSEIAAMHAAIGSSSGGALSLTSTSGPGLGLKIEGIGHAAMLEVPVVIVVCQRKGPDTGAPTKTEQADFSLVRAGSHGDIPKIVLAPANISECFWLTIEACNLARVYRCPVFVLSDLKLAEGKDEILIPDTATIALRYGPAPASEIIASRAGKLFPQYERGDSGISPSAHLGDSRVLLRMLGTSHDAIGNVTVTPEGLNNATEKLMKKMKTYLENDFKMPRCSATNSSAGFILIGWGSTEGAIQEAAQQLYQNGTPCHTMHFTHIWPLHRERLRELMQAVEIMFTPSRIVVVEENYTGQFADALALTLGRDVERINVCHGRPIQPKEIYDAVLRLAAQRKEGEPQ